MVDKYKYVKTKENFPSPLVLAAAVLCGPGCGGGVGCSGGCGGAPVGGGGGVADGGHGGGHRL